MKNTSPIPSTPTPPCPLPSAQTPTTAAGDDLHIGICPYFQRDRGKGQVYCECARFRFPDKESRREIVYRFCAHPGGYKDCMIKQALDHHYERKYGSEPGSIQT